MEDSVALQKRKLREFALASVSDLCSSLLPSPPPHSEPGSSSPGIARFAAGDGSFAELQILRESNQVALNVDLRAAQIFRLSPVQSVCMVEGSDAGKQGVTYQTEQMP
ncbi:hypothetical protein PIB30_044977 [Stylosanthes scabra]|uniref:Probable histone-arginine methyltransferase CARM1-like N-terminal PH domain-containing protein n=1 Tax=Stylosanthes scabra TaxID=79078 RepID=A0ABU6VGQ7_9FABA|nr:hypothetical protein [Stylosanthes scabra]